MMLSRAACSAFGADSSIEVIMSGVNHDGYGAGMTSCGVGFSIELSPVDAPKRYATVSAGNAVMR
ncbi:hypothetical protein [Mycetocola sp. JXN-3]|uniref:hypothetical protein n=1 Tax=Mycetocola sp. JXN-3 TaxID=2116510 RepID=UPI00165CF5F2|nr:hypothetical protein [Mycetocola sp. JXN-3]